MHKNRNSVALFTHNWLSLFFLVWVSGMDLHGPVFAAEPPHRIEFSNVSGGRVDCVGSGSPQPQVEWIFPDGSAVQQVFNLVKKALGVGLTIILYRYQIWECWSLMDPCGSLRSLTIDTDTMSMAPSINANWKALWVRSWAGTYTSRLVSVPWASLFLYWNATDGTMVIRLRDPVTFRAAHLVSSKLLRDVNYSGDESGWRCKVNGCVGTISVKAEM